MKTATALFAVLLSAQVAADCSDIEYEPVIPRGPEVVASDTPEARDEAAVRAERRKAYLDCLKPAPFTPERVDIDLDAIADDFNPERDRALERGKAVAAN